MFIKRATEGQEGDESSLALLLERLSSPAALLLVTVLSFVHLFVIFVCLFVCLFTYVPFFWFMYPFLFGAKRVRLLAHKRPHQISPPDHTGDMSCHVTAVKSCE